MDLNSLPQFSGDPINYEEQARKTGVRIKQTVYKHYLSRPANTSKSNEVARSSELYNMLLECVGDGRALNTVEKVKDSGGIECGFSAWTKLRQWYVDDTQKHTMIQHQENKLKDLVLNHDTTATAYINRFEMYVRKLEKVEKLTWDDKKKIQKFGENVIDDDYDTECRVNTKKFDESIKAVRKREQDLSKKSTKRTRRAKFVDDSSTSNKPPPSSKHTIPFFPKFIVDALTYKARRNLFKWRAKTNSGEEMGPDGLYKDDNKKDDDGSKSPGRKKDTKEQ